MMSLLFTLKMFYIPLIMIIVFFSAGGFLLHLYITARRKAKREFDALPADHPDRLKYGGILLPGSVAASYPTANVYHFPSNAQGLGVAGPLAAAASSAPPSPGQQGSSAKGSDPPGGYPHQGHRDRIHLHRGSTHIRDRIHLHRGSIHLHKDPLLLHKALAQNTMTNHRHIQKSKSFNFCYDICYLFFLFFR
ncbi:uncharacterized protein LOC122260082 [Penaeus japonicus]|uniref:uncharacterized protein LOC122260082 n=1 Tax=Penaeus japonicus TaxID=27405 RepID=UPI001C713A18|nr:uncharacterized protein LOC122260082 [Penaeus japonicus]